MKFFKELTTDEKVTYGCTIVFVIAFALLIFKLSGSF